jgi:hypothetical protein
VFVAQRMKIVVWLRRFQMKLSDSCLGKKDVSKIYGPEEGGRLEIL